MRQPYDDIPLFVGTMYDPEKHVSKLSYVVTLAPEEYPETTHAHLFTDGPHEYATFESAVETVRELLETKEPVLVHCQAGSSRSVTVASTALSLYRNEPFMDVLYRVQRNGVDPAQEVLESARKYLDENGGKWGYDPRETQR